MFLNQIFFLFFLDRCAVIVFGIITLIAGVILASVPWLNYFILKVKKLTKAFKIVFNDFFIQNRIYDFGMIR